MNFKSLLEENFFYKYHAGPRVFYLKNKKSQSLRWIFFQLIFKLWCMLSLFYRKKNQNLVEIYDRTLLKKPLKGNVLDIGTGSMWFIKYWNQQKDKIFVGIDPMIRKSAFKIINRFKQSFLVEGAGEFLPFKTEVFDEVTINSTLDHIEHPEKVISESYRTLKEKGMIRIITMIAERKKIGSPHINDIKKEVLEKMLKRHFKISVENWMDDEKNILYIEAIKN